MITDKSDYKKASIYYLIGTFFNKGIVFLTVPVFTRLLDVSDYGVVSTYNSWVGIMSVILGFALHTGVRIAFIDFKDEMKDFLASITSFTLISSAGLSILICLIVRILSIDFNSTLIVLCLLQSTAAALIEDYSMYLMMQYKYRNRTALMVLPALLSIIMSVIAIIFIYNERLYLGRIVPTALITILFGIIICFFVYSNSNCYLNYKYLRYALAFSVPLILHGIALNVLAQSDRTMITWLADSSQTGIYSLIYNFSMIATVIATSLDGIWIPWFYKSLQNKNTININIIAKDYVNLMTYCLIGVILVGPEVVKILSTTAYWEGIKIIPPVVISNFVIFSYTLYVNVEHYHKETKGITINTAIAAIINIVLNFITIPYFGYVAAAYTTLVSYFVSFALHAKKAKKLEPLLYPISSFGIPLTEIIIASFIFYIFIDSMLIRWMIAFIYLVLMLFKEWRRLKIYFPSIEKNNNKF